AVPTSGSGGSGNESYGQAIFIVQMMYKTVFLPMALLLLMPGAVMTQVKGLVTRGFLGGDEDAANPFTGIMRAIIAIFLIPATQLIVSYTIDVGNALAWEVRDPSKKFIDEQVLHKWTTEQTFNPPIGNVKNAIMPGRGGAASSAPLGGAPPRGAPPGGVLRGQHNNQSQPGGEPGGLGINVQGGMGPGGPSASVGLTGGNNGPFNSSSTGGQIGNFLWGLIFPPPPPLPNPNQVLEVIGGGKAAGQLENDTTMEDQKWLSTTMQVGFNSAAMVMGDALTILAGYQLVFMCYLFLMGPIAAAFYAWPSGIGTLFKKV